MSKQASKMNLDKYPSGQKNQAPRNIITTFYGSNGNEVIRVNRSSDVKRAVSLAVMHLQNGDSLDYSRAFVVSIYNDDTGELYSVITYSVVGEIKILFRRDPKNPTCLMMLPETSIVEKTKVKYETSLRKVQA